MTITRQLEINILTAPVATADRRCLSQAWYSALYAQQPAGAGRSKPVKARAALSVAAPSRASAASSATVRMSAAAQKNVAPARASASRLTGSVEVDRRAPRSRLARSIERAFSTPRPASGGASFTVDGIAGRVRVLLRRHGDKMVLVALCGRGARPQVRAALEQARYALAAKGVELQTEVRETEC